MLNCIESVLVAYSKSTQSILTEAFHHIKSNDRTVSNATNNDANNDTTNRSTNNKHTTNVRTNPIVPCKISTQGNHRLFIDGGHSDHLILCTDKDTNNDNTSHNRDTSASSISSISNTDDALIPRRIMIAGMQQSVFLDNCTNCTLLIEGKVTAVMLNACTGIQLTLKDKVIGSIELVHCKDSSITLDANTGHQQMSRVTVVLDDCQGVSVVAVDKKVLGTIDLHTCHCKGIKMVVSKATVMSDAIDNDTQGSMPSTVDARECSDAKEYHLPESFKTVFMEGSDSLICTANASLSD